MPVERIALMSRVPVYWTVAPVASSQGFTMAMNDSCSAPVQVPMTETEPPSAPEAAAADSPADAAVVGTGAPADSAAYGAELVPLDEHAPTMIAAAPSSAISRRVGVTAICIRVTPFAATTMTSCALLRARTPWSGAVLLR